MGSSAISRETEFYGNTTLSAASHVEVLESDLVVVAKVNWTRVGNGLITLEASLAVYQSGRLVHQVQSRCVPEYRDGLLYLDRVSQTIGERTISMEVRRVSLREDKMDIEVPKTLTVSIRDTRRY